MPGTVKLFRAVSEAEFDDVLQTGRFSAIRSSIEGKFFAESSEDARAWGEAFESSGRFRILEVEVAAADLQTMRFWPRLDGIGPAWMASIEIANRAIAIREAER